MTDHEKQLIIAHHLSLTDKDNVLPKEPTVEDLFNYSNLRRPKHWERNKRLYKKFVKDWSKYVSEKIRNEFRSKIFAKAMVGPFKGLLNRESFARKAFRVEPLPAGALPYYESMK